ncbi:MAG: hypothetical protein R6V06_01600 [Kiritimatiellia bacterium]
MIRTLCFLFFALTALLSQAQEFQLSFKPACSSFIVGEPVVVRMNVVNVGRTLLDTRSGTDRLFVEVTYQDRYNELTPVTKAPFAKAFKLDPGRKHTSRIELDKWYSLLKEGKYFAKLVLICGKSRYESTKKSFDIVPGIPVKEGIQMFVSREKTRRMFKIVHWNRRQAERLFLRVEDQPGGEVWDTIDLGPHLKSSDPKLDIAANGEITVVHKANQDTFHRTVLWSLPDSLEIAERNSLFDPEVTATQRIRSLYGDAVEEGPADFESGKKWWKFW